MSSENIINITIASPDDVKEERNIFVKEVERFNNIILKGTNIAFRPYRWETVDPAYNPAGIQKILDEGLDIANSKIFICVFFKKFGKLTMEAGSATEHELTQAIEAYHDKKSPDIKIFFKNQYVEDFSSLSDVEIKQMKLVNEFKEKILPYAKIEEFDKSSDFKDLLNTQMIRYLMERYGILQGDNMKVRIKEVEKSQESNFKKMSLIRKSISAEKINIPYILNTIRKGDLHDKLLIDFNNAHKDFKEARFEITRVLGNSWRVGLLLFGDNGSYFVFHPYVDTKDAERISLAFTNEKINKKTKLVRKIKNDIKLEELRNYQIVKEGNAIRCLINGNEKRYKDTIEELDNDRIHNVRFQFWRHDNEEIVLEVKNFELFWE